LLIAEFLNSLLLMCCFFVSEFVCDTEIQWRNIQFQ